MNELIIPPKPKGFRMMSQVFGNGKNTNSRNSRDVHKYLGVTTAYSRWIKRRIESLGVEENIDFTIAKNGKGELGQFESFDYIVTDDFAKHLGMVEKTDKGKQVRDYFIYMEKLAKYLMQKTIQDCEIKTVKTIERKDKTIKELKSSKYGKERGHGFESAFRIISNCEADISTTDFNNLLYDEGIIDSETVTITNFTANGTTSLEDKGTVLIHTDTAEAILDKYEIPRKIDSQMKFDF